MNKVGTGGCLAGWLAGIVLMQQNMQVSIYNYVIGLLLFGIFAFGPGILIWYFVKKTWKIPPRAILMGSGIGLWSAIAGIAGILYFPNSKFILPTVIALDIIAIISVPLRGLTLYNYERGEE